MTERSKFLGHHPETAKLLGAVHLSLSGRYPDRKMEQAINYNLAMAAVRMLNKLSQDKIKVDVLRSAADGSSDNLVEMHFPRGYNFDFVRLAGPKIDTSEEYRGDGGGVSDFASVIYYLLSDKKDLVSMGPVKHGRNIPIAGLPVAKTASIYTGDPDYNLRFHVNRPFTLEMNISPTALALRLLGSADTNVVIKNGQKRSSSQEKAAMLRSLVTGREMLLRNHLLEVEKTKSGETVYRRRTAFYLVYGSSLGGWGTLGLAGVTAEANWEMVDRRTREMAAWMNKWPKEERPAKMISILNMAPTDGKVKDVYLAAAVLGARRRFAVKRLGREARIIEKGKRQGYFIPVADNLAQARNMVDSWESVTRKIRQGGDLGRKALGAYRTYASQWEDAVPYFGISLDIEHFSHYKTTAKEVNSFVREFGQKRLELLGSKRAARIPTLVVIYSVNPRGLGRIVNLQQLDQYWPQGGILVPIINDGFGGAAEKFSMEIATLTELQKGKKEAEIKANPPLVGSMEFVTRWGKTYDKLKDPADFLRRATSGAPLILVASQ